MQVSTIAQVLEMPPDSTVMAVTGIVDSIYEQNTGTNSYGDWAIQNLTIKQGTEKIKVKIADRDPLPLSVRGRRIYICCTQGSKGWNGLKVKEDTFKGRTAKILSCTPTAEITFPEAEPPGSAAAAPPQASSSKQDSKTGASAAAASGQGKLGFGQTKEPPANAPTQTAQQPGAAKGEADAALQKSFKEEVHKSRAYLGKQVNAYMLCLMAAARVFRLYEQEFQEKMTPEQFQACVSSFYIQFSRDVNAESLPYDDLNQYLPPKNQQQ